MRTVGWKKLKDFAQVSLGFKSLQNQFFYLNQATIDTYGIEDRFLTPIYRMKHFEKNKYLQSAETDICLFNCKSKVEDLRGTGALKYIRAMAERAAAAKKQSGKIQSIQEALKAQGGSLWYAPKATPHFAHIWVRKAFDTNFAPYIFEEAVVVDQRCNYVDPNNGVTWQELAAFMSSSIFALVIECNGSSSLGAGALEAPTTKLRHYPFIDLTSASATQRKALMTRARAVWKKTVPVSWDAAGPVTDEIAALDEYVLKLLGNPIKQKKLYVDLAETCTARITQAQQKRTGVKKQTSTDVQAVARAVSTRARKMLESRQFPESFIDSEEESFRVCLSGYVQLNMTIDRFLDQAQLDFSDESGESIFSGEYPWAIGEIIVQAILMGRRDFLVPENLMKAKKLLDEFHDWFPEIDKIIDEGISQSALGTGYEDRLRSRVYESLKLHTDAGHRSLPREISVNFGTGNNQ